MFKIKPLKNFLALTLAIGSNSCITPEKPQHAKTMGERLQKKLQKLVRNAEHFGGGIFRVAKPSGVIWEGTYGYIDASQKIPIDAHSTFEIASITKTFTATVVLQLVEERKLKLDTPIRKLLPAATYKNLLVVDNFDHSGDITIKQLLNHTSGLAHFWDDPPYVKEGYNKFLTHFEMDEHRLWHPNETLEFVPDMHPQGLPGQRYHYSDTNYVLAGLIIEALEKKPLHEVYRTRIFDKLNMNHTYLSYRESPRSPHKEAHRYFDDDDLHGKKGWSADWASGGLVSNTVDLETFLFALAHGKIFKHAKTLELMKSWVITDNDEQELYGLGIFGIPLKKRRGMIWGHDGWGGAIMYYWPEKDIAFTGSLNQTGTEEDENEDDWLLLIKEAVKYLN